MTVERAECEIFAPLKGSVERAALDTSVETERYEAGDPQGLSYHGAPAARPWLTSLALRALVLRAVLS